jgi:hypothetical protein
MGTLFLIPSIYPSTQQIVYTLLDKQDFLRKENITPKINLGNQLVSMEYSKDDQRIEQAQHCFHDLTTLDTKTLLLHVANSYPANVLYQASMLNNTFNDDDYLTLMHVLIYYATQHLQPLYGQNYDKEKIKKVTQTITNSTALLLDHGGNLHQLSKNINNHYSPLQLFIYTSLLANNQQALIIALHNNHLETYLNKITELITYFITKDPTICYSQENNINKKDKSKILWLQQIMLSYVNQLSITCTKLIHTTYDQRIFTSCLLRLLHPFFGKNTLYTNQLQQSCFCYALDCLQKSHTKYILSTDYNSFYQKVLQNINNDTIEQTEELTHILEKLITTYKKYFPSNYEQTIAPIQKLLITKNININQYTPNQPYTIIPKTPLTKTFPIQSPLHKPSSHTKQPLFTYTISLTSAIIPTVIIFFSTVWYLFMTHTPIRI